MKRYFTLLALLTAGVLLGLGTASAEGNGNGNGKVLKPADDITRETLAGPGSVQVNTGKDILMSFGATVRAIPTSETDWDFGFGDNVDGVFSLSPLAPGVFALGDNFFKDHPNESGWVNNGYIRNEVKLYFNAMPRDRKWSFYAALEYDRPWETSSVDSRGGKDNDSSNFGLERLNASMALPMNMRLHAGFDIWNLDALDASGLIYVDDNPGFWLTGEYDTLSFNVGYFKLGENDFQADVATLNDDDDDDRDLYAGYLNWKPGETNRFKFMYAFDRIRSVSVKDLYGVLADSVESAGALPAGLSLGGIRTNETPETDSHHMGAYWIGNFGNLEVFAEGVYQFGTADDTGLSGLAGPDNTTLLEEDYDINAYALAVDVSFQCKGIFTDFPLKPHLGFMHTSGDDDPYDDKLEGYNGVNNAQRFSLRWGGENTIIGDTNLILGSLLYGYLPELYGNGTPVFTGGLQNTSGFGGGRGDNPGMTMISAGVTIAPKRFLIYKTNVNYFRWNEDFYVQNYVAGLAPTSATTFVPTTTRVKSGYMGTEWDNELTLALSKHSFIKGHASFFFPGDAIKDVTEAMGAEADDTAMRFAAEFILNF